MKKLLALVLALVMSMSLVTISNAAFKDADKISNKEAVDVMAAVGVLAGYDNGEFGATDTLTRAQACKIIAYLDLGKDVAEALPAVQVFSDLSANNWAAKYVAYCADAGYVSGVGDNKFAPDEKVTGYQFGKMLLCALGYDQKVEEMTGSSWEIKVAKLMESNSISKGTSKLGSAALTREEAAQFALNALKATCVEYDDKGSTITAGDVTIITGAKKAQAVRSNDTTLNAAVANDANPTAEGKTLQLGEKLYKGKLELTSSGITNDFGVKGKTWKYDNKSVITVANDAALTYTKDINTTDGKKALKVALEDAGVTLTVSGSDYTFTSAAVTKNPTAVASSVSSVSALAALSANGQKLEIFVDKDNHKIDQVVVTTYTVGTVDKITEVTKTANGATYTQYTIKANTSGSTTGTANLKVYSVNPDKESDGIVVYSGIAKDDVVTYVVSQKSGVAYVYPTTKVVGTQTAFTASEITVSGTKYTLGTLTQVDSFTTNSDKDYNLYLDQFGYAVKHSEIDSETLYAVVDKIALMGASGTASDQYAEAYLAFADGTTKTVRVDKIQGVKAKNFSNTNGAITYASSAFSVAVNSNRSSGNNSALESKIVTYTTNDKGNYELTYVNWAANGTNNTATYEKSVAANNYMVQNGVPALGGSVGSATEKTVFLVKTTDGTTDKFAAYTGINAVPSAKAVDTANTIRVAVDKDSKIVFVYVETDSNDVVGNTTKVDVFYSVGNDVVTVGSGSSKYYTLEGVLNGEKTTVKSKTNFATSPVNVAATALYKVELDQDGYITSANSTIGGNWSAATVVGAGQAPADNVFLGKVYNDKTTVYVIDGKDCTTGVIGDAEVGDTVYLEVVDAGSSIAAEQVTLKTVYVIKAAV